MRGEKIIFVGGAPRSGTTLVQDILDSHPDIAGGPEFDLIPNIVDLRKKLVNSIEKGRINVFCSKEEVDRYICSLIENLLFPFAKERGAKLVSEKTPSNVLVFRELFPICPNAHMIFVLRDPRGIVSSMLQIGKRAIRHGRKLQPFTRTISSAVGTTRKYMQAGFHAKEIAPDRVHIISYEKLLSSPEQETKQLCKFLGLRWSEKMMYPGEQDHVRPKKGFTFYATEKTGSNIDPTNADKWKSKLTDIQKVYVSISFQDFEMLSKWDYNFSIDHISIKYKILGRLWRYFHQMLKLQLRILLHVALRVPGVSRLKRVIQQSKEIRLN